MTNTNDTLVRNATDPTSAATAQAMQLQRQALQQPQPREIDALWSDIARLIEQNATHTKTGTAMRQVSWTTLAAHLRAEAEEFSDEAERLLTTPARRREAASELGDVLGIVLHAAQKLRITLDELAAIERDKLTQRFTTEPQPPDEDNT